ncbi:T9SS type A sorting domain-containing protein [Falsiporphyromonas endometrii]|uniref:T9SS type A sorting domain-containing protein n=1 Tax=Falsiporphyromonas endometrii TaxID=1387297 RepID=A0ABV9K962_9PORP
MVKDNLQVRYNGDLGQVAIYDMAGRMVKNWVSPIDQSFDVSELTSGQYIIVVQTKETAYPMKFIKE